MLTKPHQATRPQLIHLRAGTHVRCWVTSSTPSAKNSTACASSLVTSRNLFLWLADDVVRILLSYAASSVHTKRVLRTPYIELSSSGLRSRARWRHVLLKKKKYASLAHNNLQQFCACCAFCGSKLWSCYRYNCADHHHHHLIR